MLSSIFLFLNIGTPELVLILGVALLLFGGNKLPELARGLGKGIREFKDASDGVKREIHNQINSFDEVKTNQEESLKRESEPLIVPQSTPLDQPETISQEHAYVVQEPHTENPEDKSIN